MEPVNLKAAGRYFRESREASGLTQAQAAEAIGISQPTLCRLEQGEDVLTIVVWAEIFRVLKVDAARLAAAMGTPEGGPDGI